MATLHWCGLSLLPFGAALFAQAPSPPVDCVKLATVALQSATITRAELVPAGGFTPPGSSANESAAQRFRERVPERQLHHGIHFTHARDVVVIGNAYITALSMARRPMAAAARAHPSYTPTAQEVVP